MDLIYTNAKFVDLGVLKEHSLDLSYGTEENDFELIIGAGDPALAYGSAIYIEGTEYGGIIGGRKSSTTGETVTYYGRTWHGVLNSKILQPGSGANYLTVSGDANTVLKSLIARVSLSKLFKVDTTTAGVDISSYQFARYCKAYDGICAMLASVGAKLKMVWQDGAVRLYAEPVTDYTDDPIDSDEAVLTVEQHEHKVNHLICLGQGELAARTVVHLYVNNKGKVVSNQYYSGLDEIVETYENTAASTADELKKEGTARLIELRDNDRAEISVSDGTDRVYDIGDIVGAADITSGVSATAAVTQKIVKINNGVVTVEYKTGSK